jgi:phosphoribosylformylglycinamidine synthase
VLDDVEQHVGMGFRDRGDIVVLLGKCRNELGGSEYLAHCHNVEAGRPPLLDMNLELNVQRLTLAAIRRGLIKSAHDVAEGGLAVALAESCIAGRIGANLEISSAIVEKATENETVRPDAVLFGESQSRIILTVAPQDMPTLQQMAALVKVPLTALGEVGGERLILHSPAPQLTMIISSAVNELEWAYRGALPRLMSK